jgi:hypothetical protein
MHMHYFLDAPPTVCEILDLIWFAVKTFVKGRLRCVDRDSNPDAREGSGF